MTNYRNFLAEAKQEKTAVVTYGRMNPPTIGHVKLAKKIETVARGKKAEPFIFLSPSQNAKKDPLSPDRKVVYAEKTIGQNINIDVKPNIFKALSDIYDSGFRNVVVVVGSDRLGEFSKMIPKYNGVKGKAHGFYDFSDLDFQSSGDRDPDAEGVAGMSASKLRGYAVSGDFNNFKKGTKLSPKDSKSMYNEIRKAMKVETVSEAIGIKKDDFADWADEPFAPERDEDVKMGKQSDDKLKALHKKFSSMDMSSPANKHMHKRIEKEMKRRGTSEEAPPGREKQVLALKKKVGTEKAYAYAWAQHNKHGEPKKEEKNVDDPDVAGHQPAKYGAGLSKSTKQKRYARWEKTKKMPDDSQRAYDLAKAPGDSKPSEKESKYTKRYRAMYGEETINEKIEGLKNKSEKSGVSYGILKQVYDRGMAAWKTGHRPGTTPQQWAFARVNSFLTGGKTRTTADKDLWSKASSSKKAKKEETDIDLSFRKWNALSESDVVVDTPTGRHTHQDLLQNLKPLLWVKYTRRL